MDLHPVHQIVFFIYRTLNALLGTTRMRVTMKYNAVPLLAKRSVTVEVRIIPLTFVETSTYARMITKVKFDSKSLPA